MASNLKREILIYSVSLALLLFALRWLELRFIIFNYSAEVFTLSIAILFTGLGIWLALKLAKPKDKIILLEKEIIVEKGPDFRFNEAEYQALGISRRELEVLNLLAKGMSNEEIADNLSLSLPTIKSHLSNLYEKMGVKRRTQAIEKARKLSIIA